MCLQQKKQLYIYFPLFERKTIVHVNHICRAEEHSLEFLNNPTFFAGLYESAAIATQSGKDLAN